MPIRPALKISDNSRIGLFCTCLLVLPFTPAAHAQASTDPQDSTQSQPAQAPVPSPVPRHAPAAARQTAPATGTPSHTSGAGASSPDAGTPDAAGQTAQAPAVPAGPPAILPYRKYQVGTLLRYRMHASNRGWTYQVDATSQVLQDAAANFYESIHWSNFHSNLNQSLSQASLGFEQTLSLAAPQKYLAVPDLSRVQPMLIGPITDLLTFYSDLSLATRYNLTAAGQQAFFASKKSNSWADGHYTLLGQDAIDFKITLTSVDPDAHTATVEVQHVPPSQLHIELPAAWMHTPVAGTPNNWVQVQRDENASGNAPGYIAQVGQEEFDDTLVVDTQSGKLISAHMHNPVTMVSRNCRDEQLLDCDAATPHTIVRDIDLNLMP